MALPAPSRSVRWLKSFSVLSSLFVFFLGLTVLVGWLCNLPLLKGFHPAVLTMKPGAALCLALSGLALRLLGREGAEPVPGRRLGQACALLVVGLSLLTLLSYALARDFGLDQLLLRDGPGAVSAASPGRLPPLTAVLFLMLGSALLLLEVENSQEIRAAQWLVLPGAALSLLSLFGWLYGALVFFGHTFDAFTAVPVLVPVGLLALCAGLLAARPESGLMRPLTSPGPGGVMVRRLLLAVLFLPASLDLLATAGVKAGFWDLPTHAAFHAILLMTVFAGAVYRVSRLLERTDLQRQRDEEELRAREEELRQITTSAQDAIILVNAEGNIRLWNPAAERLFGFSSSEALGRSLREVLIPEQYHHGQFEGVSRFQSSDPADGLARPLEIWANRKGQGAIPVELSMSKVMVKGQNHGLGILRDISERKKAEATRELLLKSLEEALAEVKTLSGLLPICAQCKKIRDDQGYWNRLESYIRDRSDATFTHSICPECARQLYPEIYAQKPPGGPTPTSAGGAS